MLKRSIDLDSYELTVEQKFSHGAKRICVIFAVSALTLSALDLANIRSAASAADFIHDSRLRLTGLRIAKETLDGLIYVPEVAKSTHYHAVYVHPNWVGEMKKLVRYGIHNFYRPIAWGAGAEYPTWGIGPWNKKKAN